MGCDYCNAKKSNRKVGDWGEKILYTVLGYPDGYGKCNEDPRDLEARDISTADESTGLQIMFTKPDGSMITVYGSFVTDGSDGQFCYQTVPGLYDQAGAWRRQARAIWTGGQWTSDEVCFVVDAALDTPRT